MKNYNVKRIFVMAFLSLLLVFGFFTVGFSQESATPSQFKPTTCVLDGSTKCKKPGKGCTAVKGCPGLADWLKAGADAAKIVGAIKK